MWTRSMMRRRFPPSDRAWSAPHVGSSKRTRGRTERNDRVGRAGPECSAERPGTTLLRGSAALLVPCRGASGGHSGTCAQFAGFAPIVDAECAGSECRDLEQPAGHHHVLQEVDHLVLVGEIAV